MQTINAYLLDLTTRRAFDLFFLAFLLGAVSIWFNFLLPWLPAIWVLVYGLVLFYAGKFLLVSHSEVTKNSPYFLGFLLTLTSLFAAFYRLTPSDVELAWSYLIRQLGSALLTTLVGLPFRQFLFAYAPAQQEQDEFFRTLEEELRRSASQFRKSQTELVQLVQEFVATRESLFSEEEKASKRYVDNLTRAITIFDQAYDGFPKQISSALSGFAKSITSMKKKMEEVGRSAQAMDGNAFVDIIQQLDGFRTTTAQVSKELENFRGSVLSLRGAAQQVPVQMEALVSEAAKRSREVGTELRNTVEAIRRDLQAVDSVLNDFIRATKEHISGLQ